MGIMLPQAFVPIPSSAFWGITHTYIHTLDYIIILCSAKIRAHIYKSTPMVFMQLLLCKYS